MRDRLHVVAREETRKHALGDLAIGEHVRDAARHAQVVFEHHEAAVFETNEIGAGDRDVDVLVNLDAAHLAPVVPAAVDEFRRHDAFREDASLVVDVLQEQIDGRQTLRESAFERVPLAARDDPREQIEREDPLGALIVSVDGEGDALREERAVGFELTLPQFILRGDEQFLDQRRHSAAAPRQLASNISSYALSRPYCEKREPPGGPGRAG